MKTVRLSKALGLQVHDLYALNELSFPNIYFPVPLGSIPELPAESCAEIKASEGENALSGNHWFDSIKYGHVIQAPCNMSMEGE